MLRTWVILGALVVGSFGTGCGSADGEAGSGGNGGSGGIGGSGGMPSGCNPGSLVASAEIDVRSVSETEFSTDGVFRPFTCNGEDFLAKKSGGSRLQVVVDDGVDDDTIGSNIPAFGIATTADSIFATGSPLLQCSPSIPPTILCMSFDFSDGAGNPAFPNASVFVVVY